MIIRGIDPGPEESSFVELVDGTKCLSKHTFANEHLLTYLRAELSVGEPVTTAVEGMDPYGLRPGHETFETLEWIGCFVKGLPQCTKITRREVKRHLCGVTSATDADVRDALIHRFGPGKKRAVGIKKTPGPLYGITKHLWAALAVAIVAYDQMRDTR